MNKNMILVENQNRDIPLPLLVSEKWDFLLAYHEIDGEFWYAIQDWIKGLISSSSNKASEAWTNLQRTDKLERTFSKRSLPYTATDGKTYQRDFTTDAGLYLIAQNLRSTKDRPLLKEIKEYLAAAGVFVDDVRRDPEQLLEALANDNPDAAMSAAIEAYKRKGKSMAWINARLAGKISRVKFTAALKAAVLEVTQDHYRMATDDIYLGLWKRTSAMLRRELEIAPGKSLRDGQPTLALRYQDITEDIISTRLGERDIITWNEARTIVQEVAKLIGLQAYATSQYFGYDIATGKPLLKG